VQEEKFLSHLNRVYGTGTISIYEVPSAP
jgi:hypothetical protein